jgi:hypothetical protein
VEESQPIMDPQAVFAAIKQGECAMEKLSQLENEMNQLLVEVRTDFPLTRFIFFSLSPFLQPFSSQL